MNGPVISGAGFRNFMVTRLATYTLTLLGCGTSGGVPMPGCGCAVCSSTLPRNKRFRTAAHIKSCDGLSLLIDAGTDLRMQCLTHGIRHVDGVLFTHAHADHILGIDDLRAFNFLMQRSIPCWGIPRTLAGIKTTFSYVFEPDPDYDSGSLAKLDLLAIHETEQIAVKGLSVQTIPVLHGTLPVSGFRFGDVAYITDCNYVSDESKAMLQNLDVLFLDALRDAPHPSHFTIAEAVALAQELSPRQTYLIHMSHNVDYTELVQRLPAGIAPGYDGLQVNW